MNTKTVGSLDALFTALGLDPGAGVRIIVAHNLPESDVDRQTGTLLLNVNSPRVAGEVKKMLIKMYPAEHLVTVVSSPGVPGEEKQATVPLGQLDQLDWVGEGTCLYLPPAPGAGCRYPLDPLVRVMAALRGEKGCPWDKQQTHRSLRQYLLEECYEVLEAIEENDMHKLCEELGDLLLQIVFHAHLANERGDFSLNDVVAKITEKMIRRHPHVFGDLSVRDSEEVLLNWQRIKQRERGDEEKQSILDGIPRHLPALLRAQKIQARAARVGFDWETIEGAWEKVEEELAELKQAYRGEDAGALEEEIGDLLFAIVNIARFLGVEPELALTRTNDKFVSRFRYIEETAREAGRELQDMTLVEMDGLWEEAKNNGRLCKKRYK